MNGESSRTRTARRARVTRRVRTGTSRQVGSIPPAPTDRPPQEVARNEDPARGPMDPRAGDARNGSRTLERSLDRVSAEDSDTPDGMQGRNRGAHAPRGDDWRMEGPDPHRNGSQGVRSASVFQPGLTGRMKSRRTRSRPTCPPRRGHPREGPAPYRPRGSHLRGGGAFWGFRNSCG